MKRASILPIALTVAVLVACGEKAPAEGDARPPEGTPPVSVRAPATDGGLLIVTPEEVRRWQDATESFVLIDARDTVQYAREHIPGAINVPYVEIRAGGRLPARDRRIVVYCSSETCPISQYAYEAFQTLGYREIYDMRAGLQGWKEAGFPTVLQGESPVESP